MKSLEKRELLLAAERLELVRTVRKLKLIRRKCILKPLVSMRTEIIASAELLSTLCSSFQLCSSFSEPKSIREGFMELEWAVRINASLNRKRRQLEAEREKIEREMQPHVEEISRLEVSRNALDKRLRSVRGTICAALEAADQVANEEARIRWQE